jgi:hypothetical protein
MSFTGFWKLNPVKSADQKKFISSMGRPKWQIGVINKAHEDFRLLHFNREFKSHNVHFFDKDVRIFLNSSVLKVFSKLFRIPFNQVTYKHKLIANQSKKIHANDSKEFGPCYSITSWSEKDHTFTIRWYLAKGILKVVHSITEKDEFKMDMTFYTKGKEFKTFKVYDRYNFRPQDLKYIRNHPEQASLVVGGKPGSK